MASGHLQEFRLGIPAHKPSCLGDIINAGWMYYKEAQNGYGLRLMSVDSTDGLLNDGRNLVIIAIVGSGVHIRIFDANGERVVDAPENELISGETLTDLKRRLNPLPDEAGLSQEQKQNFIQDAVSIAGHTPQDANEILVDKVDRLNEMVLKTVEVLEYRRRTRNGT